MVAPFYVFLEKDHNAVRILGRCTANVLCKKAHDVLSDMHHCLFEYGCLSAYYVISSRHLLKLKFRNFVGRTAQWNHILRRNSRESIDFKGVINA